jgi:hypothetical protein
LGYQAVQLDQTKGEIVDTYTFKIGQKFLDDHIDRALALSSGGIDCIKTKTKTHYVIELTLEDALDLVSDSNHYSTEWVQMGREYIGLGMSAMATKKAMAKQLVAHGYVFTDREIKNWSLARLI